MLKMSAKLFFVWIGSLWYPYRRNKARLQPHLGNTLRKGKVATNALEAELQLPVHSKVILLLLFMLVNLSYAGM